MVTASATVSLTGPLALQGRQAAHGLELWASADQIQLQIVDDASSPTTACDAYQRWLGGQVDLLIGPYGSGLVRLVGPVVSAHGALLWNHGGAADDLIRPLVVPVSASASTYFRGAVDLAHRRGLARVVFAQGRGRFASAVVSGARQRAAELGLAVQDVPLADWATAGSLTKAAVLIVGTFTEDLAVVEQIRAGPEPGLLGCVAAGLLEFGKRLGRAADGVVGPVKWIAHAAVPQVGPSGAAFSQRYESENGEPPDYVAAQAAAAGYLAAEAHRRRYQHHQLNRWRTTTMLGNFALDESWRQFGHSPITIEWRGGRQEHAT
ncbi:MAG TPA: ABC transporter substrate-binding protein [Gemmatimonadales bacterium]|nr:ABC transporter substrate-binding protein [Gemmatimonadales bacterium]